MILTLKFDSMVYERDDKKMQNDFYVREEKIVEKTEIEKEAELIKSIIKTREELKIANRNFEYAQDGLVDYYTYQIKANQSKIDYLLKKIKKKGLILDMIDATSLEAENKNEVG